MEEHFVNNTNIYITIMDEIETKKYFKKNAI